MNTTSKNNTLCWYAFHQIAVKGWEKGVGPTSITPCCNMVRPDNIDPMSNTKYLRQNKGNFSVIDIFNSDTFTELRKSMMNGEKHPACDVCWKQEEISDHSYRLKNPMSRHTIDIEIPKIKSIDIGTGDLCNLACRMCSPGNSNKLRKDQNYFIKNNMTHMTTENKMWGWNKTPGTIHEVRFVDSDTKFYNSLMTHEGLIRIKASGGEPLLSDMWMNWVDYLIKTGQSKNIVMDCHTNATKFSDENIERLLQFKEVSMNMSIDATHKIYEYIRFPMTWEALNRSVVKFTESIPAEKIKVLKFNSVFSVYNAFNILDFVKWSVKMFSISNASFMHLQFDRVFPIGGNLDIVHLPRNLKEDILIIAETAYNEIKDMQNVTTNLSYIIAVIKIALSDPDNYDAQCCMKREIVSFDKSRNQTYRDYLDTPLVSWLDSLPNI